MRINHFISRAGVCSRRKADELVVAGKIRINGDVIRDVGIDVAINSMVEISKNGVWSKIMLPSKTVTYALNKPVGFTSTSADKHARHLITELVPKFPRVYSVGRLDEDSEGLILLTNDGELTNRLTHPSNHVAKTYIALVSIPPKYEIRQLSANLSKLESGVLIDGHLTGPAKLKLISNHASANNIEVKIVLSEGRNRQIRKMFQKIGLNVVKLTRIAIGKLELKALKINPGQYKVLSEKEYALLK